MRRVETINCGRTIQGVTEPCSLSVSQIIINDEPSTTIGFTIVNPMITTAPAHAVISFY